MSVPPALRRTAILGIAAITLVGCADTPPALTGPSTESPLDVTRTPVGGPALRAAMTAQERHEEALFAVSGVVGTAVGRLPNGRPIIRVFTATPKVKGVPSAIDGIQVVVQNTGLLVALSDPTTRQRPAPLGFSVGHPSITAGTIGARVVDAAGVRYVLSNNHVLAASNAATIGDPMLQPGTYDGGTAADQIGTLSAFYPIVFSSTASNTMDAAIAQTTTDNVLNETPADDGYGAPSTTMFGDANSDGVFDDKNALLGLAVQKYGRTTKLTKGQITGINGTLTICYEVVFIFCLRSARFVDQLIIEPGGFSGGGDSGSLIVTDDANRNPVALLFAGSTAQTIANRIDLVLSNFGVTIDGGTAPPPAPLNDVEITSVTGPSSVTVGGTANIAVTVRNAGNQAIASAFDVSLQDATDGVAIGTQSVAGLAVGASTTLTFPWNTTGRSLGTHTLTASHAFADDNSANDQRSMTVTVNAPAVGMHIGDLDGFASRSSSSWSATVEITVHDANHNPINGATVVGKWSRSGLNANTCTTGELGGDGTCIVLFPALSLGANQVRFTVQSVTRAGSTYESDANHDVDGSSNGTYVVVRRP
jgi:hypothetical protein